MKWIREYGALLAIGLLLIIIFFMGWFLGKELAENRAYKEDLKKANLEFKQLQEANKISIENAKSLIVDSVAIYVIFAEREASKSVVTAKKINKVKKETNDKIEAIDSFSLNANIKYFESLTTRLSQD